MADLLRFCISRNVEQLPAEVVLKRGIFTHVHPDDELLLALGRIPRLTPKQPLKQPIVIANLLGKPDRKAEDVGGKLYNKLKRAKEDGDLEKVVKLAQEFLSAENILSEEDFSPETKLAMRYLTGTHQPLTPTYLGKILAYLEDEDKYFESKFAQDLNRVVDSFLAHHVLEEPRVHEIPFTDAVRGLTTLCQGYFIKKFKSRDAEALAPLDWIAHAPVFLPSFAFDLNRCRWRDPRPRPRLVDRLEMSRSYADKMKRLESRNPDQPLPDEPDPCNCAGDCDPECLPQNPCCPEIQWYVTDYMLIRDQLHCYKAADIAYIEVIAAGEKRKRVHETKLTREENYELESTTETKEERDHQLTDRSSLQSEMNKALQQSLDVSAKVNAKGMAGTWQIDSDVSMGAKLSKSQAEKLAREQVRELVQKSVMSVQEKVRTLRKQRVLSETSELNKHVYDNASGSIPKVTKYFWVTQQKRAQVYSYGTRMTLEFLIPSPAMLYEELERRKAASTFTLLKPEKPAITPNAITKDTYLALLMQYELEDVSAPPEMTQTITVRSNETPGDPDGSGNATSGWTNFQCPVVIPDGYFATNITVSADYYFNNVKKDDELLATVNFSLGSGTVGYHTNDVDYTSSPINPPVSGAQTINIQALNMTSWNALLTIYCTLPASKLLEWQLPIYNQIMKKYRDQLADYEAALEEHRRKTEKKIKGRHPFYNREIEQSELKRAAIYLMCESFGRKGAINAKSEPCGYPELDRGKAAKHGEEWYFWDRVIDWNLMSYIFFDYFWNPMCSWPEKFDPDEPDALFKAFRRAGYARIQVPVSEGMESDMLYYIKTGVKWGGVGAPMDPSDQRWISIVEELKHQRDCYQDDREGFIDFSVTLTPGTKNIVTIQGSDRYANTNGSPDPALIGLDIDREIFIDLVPHRIISIALNPNSPPFTGANTMWWDVTLERDYDGDTTNAHKYAVGAKYVGAPFLFELPTELVWAGAHNDCLPCYPLPEC